MLVNNFNMQTIDQTNQENEATLRSQADSMAITFDKNKQKK